MIAVKLSERLCTAGVAAGFRFGETPCADLFAFRQRSDKTPALVFRAETVDVAGTKRIMGRNRNADRAIHSRQLFDDGDVLCITKARATVFGWNENAKKAELSELFENVGRKDLLLVPLHDARANFFFCEFTHDAFYFEQFLTEAELHIKSRAVRSLVRP